MTAAILGFLGSLVAPFAGWIALIVAGIVAVLGFGVVKKRQGATAQRQADEGQAAKAKISALERKGRAGAAAPHSEREAMDRLGRGDA